MTKTRKQKGRARKWREANMLSFIENLDIMRCSNHLEREGSEFSNTVRRPESPS